MVELFFVVYCLHLTLGSVVFLGLGSLDLLDVEVVSEVTYDGLVETWILLLDSPQERLLDLRVQSGLVDLCVELAGCRLRQLRWRGWLGNAVVLFTHSLCLDGGLVVLLSILQVVAHVAVDGALTVAGQTNWVPRQLRRVVLEWGIRWHWHETVTFVGLLLRSLPDGPTKLYRFDWNVLEGFEVNVV